MDYLISNKLIDKNFENVLVKYKTKVSLMKNRFSRSLPTRRDASLHNKLSINNHLSNYPDQAKNYQLDITRVESYYNKERTDNVEIANELQNRSEDIFVTSDKPILERNKIKNIDENPYQDYNQYIFKAFYTNQQEPSKELFHTDRVKYIEQKKKADANFLSQLTITKEKVKKLNHYLFNQHISEQRIKNIRERRVTKESADFTYKIGKDTDLNCKNQTQLILPQIDKYLFYDKNRDIHISRMYKIKEDKAIPYFLKSSKILKSETERSKTNEKQKLEINLCKKNQPYKKNNFTKLKYFSNNKYEKLRELGLKVKTEGKSLELLFEINQFIAKNKIPEYKVNEVLGKDFFI